MRSISQLNLRKEDTKFLTSASLPPDFTLDIPPIHAVWLYKAGIFASTAVQYSIGWSEKLQRIILPVYKDGKLIYTQARAVHKGQEKYLNRCGEAREKILFRSAWSKYLLSAEVVVLTEDILSAIRTGIYLPSYSTLGTELTDTAAFLLSKRKFVIVWYDNDKGGHTGSIKVVKKLESIGVPCINYKGIQDPKYYTNQELIDIFTKLIKEVS